MGYRKTAYQSGLGLKAPMHLNYNLSQIRTLRPGITHFIMAAGMDDGCDHGGAHSAPYNCHDIANWQNAVVKVWIDGNLSESPVLQAESLQWVFNVSLPPASTLFGSSLCWRKALVRTGWTSERTRLCSKTRIITWT